MQDTISAVSYTHLDEIELALHPSAIMRLVDFLQKLATEYDLCLLYTSDTHVNVTN